MDKREKLAELCHEQWSGWMKYLFSKCENEFIENTQGRTQQSGNIIIPEWAVKRWQRQINTPYAKLSDDEKESDRKEADKFLKLLEEQNKNG